MKRKLFATLICLLMMATLLPVGSMASVEYVGENLLKNGSFDTPNAKDSTQPADWTTLNIAGLAEKGVNYKLISGTEDGETVKPYSGGYAYKIDGSNTYDSESAKNSRMYIYQALPELEIGKQYVLSGYINITAAQGARVYMATGTSYDGKATGGAIAYTGADITTDGWKKFSLMLSPTVETGTQFTIVCVVNSTAVAYFDNFSFYEKKNDTLLLESGEFEALHTDAAFSKPAASWFDSYTKEGTHYDYVTENGQTMVKMYGKENTSGIKAIHPAVNSAYVDTTLTTNKVQNGDIIKLKFDAKLISSSTELADAYVIQIAHNTNKMYGSASIPSEAVNKWVTIEYWFEAKTYLDGETVTNFTNLVPKAQSISIRQPQGTPVADVLYDNFELYVDNDSYIGAGKTIASISGMKEVKDATDESVVIASAKWSSRTSINESYTSADVIQPYVRFANATASEETVIGFAAIYEELENGSKMLVALTNAPLTVAAGSSDGAVVPVSLENIVLDANKTYCIETFLWDGSTIKPIVDKAESSITVLSATPETP